MKPQREQRLELLVDANPKWVYEAGAAAKAGLSFDCPIHFDCRIAIPFANPVDGPSGKWAADHRGGWLREGDDFGDLSVSTHVLGITPSIQMKGGAQGCEWHGFVRNGRFEHCGDSR